MARKVVVSGVLGGIVLIVWTFVINGLFGFRSRIDMNRIPEERRVYELLKETVTEPGYSSLCSTICLPAGSVATHSMTPFYCRPTASAAGPSSVWWWRGG